MYNQFITSIEDGFHSLFKIEMQSLIHRLTKIIEDEHQFILIDLMNWPIS